MNNRKWIVALAAVALTTFAVQAQEEKKADAPAAAQTPAFSTDAEKLSYIFGIQIGSNLAKMKQDGIDMNLDVFFDAVKEANEGKPLRMSQEEIQSFMMSFQQQLSAKMQEKAAKAGEAGKAFMAENAKKEGVKTQPSGLQYKVISDGSGASPKATDTVKVNYKGSLPDGTVFDESDEGKPVEFQVNRVIPGWTEALQLMKKGAHWQLFIPADLAYGMNPPPGSNIPPNSPLVFDVTLVDVQAGPAEPETVNLPQPKKAQ